MAFTSFADKWLAREAAVLKRTELAMASAMVNRGRMLAPHLTGALKASGRVVADSKGTSAVFGGAEIGVPYARRRHFENRKNPQTLLYLQKAGDSVAKEGVSKYYNLSE